MFFCAGLLNNHLYHPPHHMYAQHLPPTNNMFGGALAAAHSAAALQQSGVLLTDMVRERMPDDAWQNYMLKFDAGEGCGFQGCEVEDLQHYHCKDEGCETVFRNDDGVRDHGRNHFLQDQITEAAYVRMDPDDDDVPMSQDTSSQDKNILHWKCKWVSAFHTRSADLLITISF